MTVIEHVKPIGGYFELELPTFPEYHCEAIALNSGRFCLEYILRCRNYNKIYIPFEFRFIYIKKSEYIKCNIKDKLLD